MIGRRLKFSVGHNHVEIIIGNPVCLCKNIDTSISEQTDNIVAAYSLCNKKDVYSWKTGVIQALDNLCENWTYSKERRRDLRKALAKKYPEIFRD
jgi:hypothetical protein